MKKLLILISIVIVAAIMFVYLYRTADIINKKDNGFKRNILNEVVKTDKAIPNKLQLIRVVGIRDGRVYFMAQGADYLLSTNLDLNDQQKIPLGRKYTPGTTYGLDSDHIYSYSVNENTVSLYDLKGRLEKDILLKEQFSRVFSLTKDIFVIKDFKKIMEGVTFAKIRIDSINNDQTRLNEVNLESYKNNPFANDGLLMYDRDSATIVYMNFYRNSYFVLDTSFSTVVKHNTIDTINSVNVTTKTVKEKKRTGITNYSPANVTNKYGLVNNGKIHILSNLIADGQDRDQFKTSTTIDVYQLQSGKYQYSYILPDCNNAKVRDVFITDSTMISIYPDSIVKYRLSRR